MCVSAEKNFQFHQQKKVEKKPSCASSCFKSSPWVRRKVPGGGGWRGRGPGPPTGSTHHHRCRQQQASKRSIVSPLGWKTQMQFPLRSTGRLFRACGVPGRGPPEWTGRPRLGPGCGSGCCRWRETVEGQIINWCLIYVVSMWNQGGSITTGSGSLWSSRRCEVTTTQLAGWWVNGLIYQLTHRLTQSVSVGLLTVWVSQWVPEWVSR